MAVLLSPVGGVAAQFFTNAGVPLSGGKIYTYAAGTSTPQATYTTGAGNVQHSNPIVLDAAGRVPTGEIWLTDGLSYKFVLKDNNDVLIATYDNIVGINSNFVNFVNQQEIQTATANQTVFNLTTMEYQPGTGNLSVFVDGVNQYGPGAQYAYTETDSNTVTFVSGLHVGASVKFTTTEIQNSGVADASQIAYDPPFADSVATNVEDKLAQYVSVKDFGAVGDWDANTQTGTDNTAAFQAALDTKKTVFIPAGSYMCSGSLYLVIGQILCGEGFAESKLYYTGTSGVFINGDLSTPISSGGNWESDYGDTLYNADGAQIKELSLWGTWTANSINTSIGIAGQFGGVNYGGVQNVMVRNFNIGVQLAGSIQYCRGVWFTSCLFGWKTSKTVAPFSSNFNDTFLVDGCWASWCGQVITQTPTAVSYSGNIVTINVPDASKFMQWTTVTQATKDAVAVIHSVNTGTNQISGYMYKGTFDAVNLMTNHQGACYWLSETTQNCRFTHNEISESQNGIVTMFGGQPTYIDQFWVDIGMTGSALVETNSGSIIQGPIGFCGVAQNTFITDPTVFYGYPSFGSKTALYNDGTVPGYGMVLPNNQPVRCIYNGGYKTAITDEIVQVMGAGAGASDAGVGSTVQYSWVVNKSAGNAPTVLSIGYNEAIAVASSLTTGEYTPTPLTGKLVDFIANGVNSAFQPSVDALTSLGTATNRWNVVYAATGTINTSDANEKTEIVDLSEAEKRVATRLKSEIKRFKFKEAVDKKGDKARYHFGAIAQQVKVAFHSEGLNAEDYGVFCSDELEDGSVRLGVRYDELFAFIIAGL